MCPALLTVYFSGIPAHRGMNVSGVRHISGKSITGYSRIGLFFHNGPAYNCITGTDSGSPHPLLSGGRNGRNHSSHGRRLVAEKISNNYFDGIPTHRNQLLALMCVVFAYFFDQLDNNVLGFAAPSIMRSFA